MKQQNFFAKKLQKLELLIRIICVKHASKGKGKSGGARIITYNIQQIEETIRIDLLTIYDKGEISNVSDSFIKYLLEKEII